MNALLQGVECLLFDFGGVLVDLDGERVARAFARLGLDVRPYLGQYVQSGVLAGFETGQTSLPQFFDEVRRLGNRPDLNDRQIWQAWDSFLVGIPAARLDLLLRLKEHYRLLLLSNTNYIHWFRAQNDLFLYRGHTVSDFFEHTFLSFEMGLAKPDEAIFRAVVAQSGLCPERTLFVDDSAENCAAARRLGLKAFCPHTPNEWMNLFKESYCL